MSSTRKTIKINPELFGLSKKSKTMSKRDKKPKIPSSAMRPNTLRKKLIERVKQHKMKEGGGASKTGDSAPEPSARDTKIVRDITDLEDKYHEEFRDSIDYLSDIASKYNDTYGNTNAGRNAKGKAGKKRKFTKKRPVSHENTREELHVELNLPSDLQEVPHNTPLRTDDAPMKLQLTTQYKIDDVPYGCLKGGVKPTYKTWNKTLRHNEQLHSQQPSLMTNTDAGARLRQEKLTQLKERMRDRQNMEKTRISNIQTSSQSVPVSQMLPMREVTTSESLDISDHVVDVSEPSTSLDGAMSSFPPNSAAGSDDTSLSFTSLPAPPSQPVLQLPQMPKKIKKVTTKTYKLGKNKAKRQYGVLIKNNQTRKQILNAQREIKKAPLADIKSYLRDKGLIKSGSKAPTDILKKMYETSMLSGDITNTDQDIHMHNFMDGHDNESV